jgi:hypothetical protein
MIVSPGATKTGFAPALSIPCNIPNPVTLTTAQYRKVTTYSVTLFHCTSSLSVYAVIKTYKPHLLPVVNSYKNLRFFLQLHLIG